MIYFFSIRYIFYDVNPSEGFNLRRDVYVRVATFIQQLVKENTMYEWKLVLPPWGNTALLKKDVNTTFFNF